MKKNAEMRRNAFPFLPRMNELTSENFKKIPTNRGKHAITHEEITTTMRNQNDSLHSSVGWDISGYF